MLCLHNPKWAGTPTAQSRRESGRLDRPHGGSCPRKPQIASHVTAAHSLPISPIKTQLSERNMPSYTLVWWVYVCATRPAAGEYQCTRVFLARISRCSPAFALAIRIGLWFVILSNRLGQDLTPFYLFMSVGQSQYSSYSNELRISEPFYESSEEWTWRCSASLWKHGKMASRQSKQTQPENNHLLACVREENAHEKFKHCWFPDAALTQNITFQANSAYMPGREWLKKKDYGSGTFSLRCTNIGLPEPHYFVNSSCQKFTIADIWCLGTGVLLARVALKSSFVPRRDYTNTAQVRPGPDPSSCR